MSRKVIEVSQSSDETVKSSEREFAVEAIRKWRFHLRKNRKEYFIKWLDYDESENTWEPEENLNCSRRVREFEKTLSSSEAYRYHHPNPRKMNGFKRNAKVIKIGGGDLRKDGKVSCLILFDDTDEYESIPIDSVFEGDPEIAMKFCEQRLVDNECAETSPTPE